MSSPCVKDDGSASSDLLATLSLWIPLINPRWFILTITLSVFVWSFNTDQTYHRLVQTWKWQKMHYFFDLWRNLPRTHRITRTTTNSMFYQFSVSIVIILIFFSCSFWCMCSSFAFIVVVTWPGDILGAISGNLVSKRHSSIH